MAAAIADRSVTLGEPPDSDWVAATRDRYASSGLLGALPRPARPGIIVVDLQVGFTDPAFPPGSELGDVVGATRRLLDRARDRGLPIWFTVIAFSADQLSELVWLQKMPAMRVLTDGAPTVALDPGLGHRAGDEPVLVKRAASAFATTDLASRVRVAEVDGLIVCGATTSGCVRATVVDACANNWPTFVVRECVGDREQGPHLASLLDIEAKYADVIDLADAEQLVAAATRP